MCKLNFCCFLFFCFFISFSSLAQFGNGSDGNLTVSTNTNLSLTATNVTSAVGASLTVLSNAGFLAGNQILILQMTGAVAAGKVGNWERFTVLSTSSTNIVVLNSPLTKLYDFATEKVQLIALPQYNNVTISNGAILSTSSWNGSTGGILAFLVANNLDFIAGGSLNMTGKGFVGTIAGNGGTAGSGGTAGIAGAVGTNGGNIGTVINTGIFGGGDGGAKGSLGISGGTALVLIQPGAGVIAGNASIPASKRFMMGAGGKGGDGGNGGDGAGGGGGASDMTATNGTAGGNGGNGGDGDIGGNGGGLIMVFANNVNLSSGSPQFITSGTVGGNGRNATDGGIGGNGGTGSGRNCLNLGGGGGGGNGANGGNGGNGGAGGAGGFVYLNKNTVIPSFTASNISVLGGSTSLGGIGGAGGLAGINGNDLGTTVVVCAGVCTSDTFQKIMDFVHSNATINTPFGHYETAGQTVDFVDGGAFLDCNNNPYAKVQVNSNITGVLHSFTLYTDIGVFAALINFVNSNIFGGGAGAYSGVSIGPISGGSSWINECFILPICISRALPINGNPGANGVGGPAGGMGDFFEDNSTPLPLELLLFEGKIANKCIKLDWLCVKNDTEIDFEIQKMDSNSPSFVSIGNTDSCQTRENTCAYQFVDKSPVLGKQYYKLKQLDTNGSSIYSNTIEINYINELNDLAIYPNPADNVVHISLNPMLEQSVNWTLINFLGNIVKQGNDILSPSNNSIAIVLENLPNTYYIMRVVIEGKSYSQIIVKE